MSHTSRTKGSPVPDPLSGQAPTTEAGTTDPDSATADLIVELQSVHKRLRAFEATIHGEELPDIDQRYLERQGVTDPA